MDEHPCTLPLEYSAWTWMLGFGSHFVDMKFTDDCGQVKMERVYYFIEPPYFNSGIIKKVQEMRKKLIAS